MSTQAYPLQWPKGWPKTEPARKESGRFQKTLAAALNALRIECSRLGGKNLVLSSNVTLDNARPKESGVVAYFQLDESQIAIPCDRWILVEHNVQAIALTIEAMRGMERWGAKHMIKAMFTGFKALPEKAGGKPPREILGIYHGNPLTEVDVTAAFRAKSKIYHPDVKDTGDAEAWREIREAHDLLMQNLKL